MLKLALAVLLVAFALPSSAHAAGCGDIRTHNISCGEAQRLLEQWDTLPKNPVGWYCADQADGRALCAAGNGGGAPYFTFPHEPFTVEVIEPPGAPNGRDFIHPWTRFGMTEGQWHALEDDVRTQVCRGWQSWVFGCAFGGLTIDRHGRIVAQQLVEGGVGSALARLIGRAARIHWPSAIANAVVRLPIRIKTLVTAAGGLPSPLARIPAYGRAGRKTTGILDVVTREFPLMSGRPGYSPLIPRGTPGFDGVFRTHVEGHAVAYMRLKHIREATLYINRLSPCERVCMLRIPRALPKGYILRVVVTSGRIYKFKGR